MASDQDLKQALRAAARDLSKRPEATSLRYEHGDAIQTAGGEPRDAMRDLLGSAAPDQVAALVDVARLLSLSGLEEAIGDAALRRPAPLAAKRAAVRALESAGTAVPAAVTDTLALVERFVESPDSQTFDAVSALPDAWRQPALDAWLATGAGNSPELVSRALESGSLDAATAADRLGSANDAGAAEVLQQLVSSEDRAVVKAAKRALHQLRARGIEVEEESTGGGFSLEIEPNVAGDSMGFATGVDGLGGRILWLLAPNRSGGYALLEAVIDDVHGVRKAEVLSTTRGDFRRHMSRLRENPSVLVTQSDPAAVAGLLATAAALNEQSSTELPAAFGEFRSDVAAALFDAPRAGAEVLPAPPDEEDTRRERLRESVELLGAPYFANWAVLGEASERAANAVRAAETSELLVDDDQRKEQIDKAVASVADSFDATERGRFKTRLHTMAAVLASVGQAEAAVQARVAGDAFETISDLYADHPFARAIIQRGVMSSYQHLREQEPPASADSEKTTSRIIQ